MPLVLHWQVPEARPSVPDPFRSGEEAGLIGALLGTHCWCGSGSPVMNETDLRAFGLGLNPTGPVCCRIGVGEVGRLQTGGYIYLTGASGTRVPPYPFAF